MSPEELKSAAISRQHMKKKDLCEKAGISPASRTKRDIRKDVSFCVLASIVICLHVLVSDAVGFVGDASVG